MYVWIPAAIIQLSVAQPAAPAPLRMSLIDYYDPNIIIAGGEVIRIRSAGRDYHKADIRITHIYHGPKRLHGFEFVDEYALNHLAGSPAERPFQKGQVGIWSLSEENGVLNVDFPAKAPRFARARQGVEPNYPQVKIVAETIEQLDKLDLEQQAGKARDFVFSQTSELAIFAVRVLARANRPSDREFLNKLATDAKVNIPALLVLDEAFGDTTKGEWWTSKRRLEMLGTWMSRRMTDREAEEVFGRLGSDFRQGYFDLTAYLTLLKAGVDCQLGTSTQRKLAVRNAGLVARSPFTPRITADDEVACQKWLVELVKGQRNLETRIEAARILKNLAQRNLSARDLVQELLETEKDEHIRAELIEKK